MKSKGNKTTISSPKVPPNTQAKDEKRPLVTGSHVNDEEDENIRFLLEQKLALMNMAGNVCMAWWVSSVVFCGSILAVVWLNRSELVESGMIDLLGIALSIFFVSIINFGALIIWFYLGNLRKEICDLTKKEFFSTELSTLKWTMINGTFSFFLILLLWIVIWIGLSSGWWKKTEALPPPPNNKSFNPPAR